MKRVQFVLLPPVGDIETQREGTVVDLLDAIPYLITSHIVPPLEILNEVLRKGLDDAGMSGGCRWLPFELMPAEFNELTSALAGRSGENYARYIEPPDWVSCFEDWRYWVLEYCHGIPAKPNLEFSRKITKLENEKNKAEKLGDHAKAGELMSKILDVSMEQSEWIIHHRKPHIWER
jgi:hypothetical protein